jgi:hypothetical protein
MGLLRPAHLNHKTRPNSCYQTISKKLSLCERRQSNTQQVKLITGFLDDLVTRLAINSNTVWVASHIESWVAGEVWYVLNMTTCMVICERDYLCNRRIKTPFSQWVDQLAHRGYLRCHFSSIALIWNDSAWRVALYLAPTHHNKISWLLLPR